MKILHIVPSMLAKGGGPSASVPMTAVAQMKTGARVSIAFRDCGELSEHAKNAQAEGVTLYAFKSKVRPWNPLGFSWRYFRDLEKIAAEHDVVITHANWLFFVWWGAYVAHKLGKPYYMMPRGSFAPERLKISAWKKKLVGVFDKWAVRHCTAVWGTAQQEAEDAKLYVPGVKTEVFPIGLNLKNYEVKYRARGEAEGERRTLLFFSRISYVKGLDMLAEAWSRIAPKNWKLLIVGPDDRGYTEEIKKIYAEKCAAESYEFRGPCYGEEKKRLLVSADAFILPTRNENWGIAVAEGMASGLPTICTKGAPWECLNTHDAGWWCEASVEGIEGALRELIASDEATLTRKGANARKWVEENLNWDIIGKKMLETIKRDLAK